MEKKCKIVMLPTDNESNITRDCEENELILDNVLVKSGVVNTTLHLYILSDDEIKGGDFYYSVFHNRVWKAPKGFIGSRMVNPKSEYKVIATTDNSLHTTKELFHQNGYSHNVCKNTCLPSLSQSFIEHYASEYNKGNKIEEVMVEYVTMNKGYNDKKDYPYQEIDIIKLNSDNSINIKPIKTEWNREEVRELCSMAWFHSKTNELTFDEWVKYTL